MPMHDWTRADAGLYHHFHQQWSGAVCHALNVGEPVPDGPLFLRPGVYVPCPLDAAYQETWRVFPTALKSLLG